MSNHTLSEEKKQKKLINANVITKHNTIIISCDEQCGYPASAYSNIFQ